MVQFTCIKCHFPILFTSEIYPDLIQTHAFNIAKRSITAVAEPSPKRSGLVVMIQVQ